MSQAYGNRHQPSEIRLKREAKTLEIDFEDGRSFVLPAEYLRVESPSAEVQGHGPDTKTIVAGRRHVGIIGVEPVGSYAIRIRFDGNVDRSLPWAFTPVQQTMDVKIGETALAFFKATNETSAPVTGTAVFNVAPELAARYFTKIE